MSQMQNKLQSQFTSSRHESQSTLNQKSGENQASLALIFMSYFSSQRLKVRYKVRGTALFWFFPYELQWDLKFISPSWSL